MGSYPPPPYTPPPGFDPRDQRRYWRDQAKAQARAQKDMWRAQSMQMRYQMRGMRRTSILGPILLIAIGVVFLMVQTGRLSRQFLWGWYSHWWPALLVGAGILLLAEWAWDQYRLRDGTVPQYRRTVGGGVFTLLMLMILAGFIATGEPWMQGMHFNPDDIDHFLGDKHESDQTLDLAFASGSSLTVMDPRGDVTLSGTSDDGRIHIAVHKQIYSRSDSEADKKTEQLNPTTSMSGSDLTLTVPSVEGGRADLVISLPANSPSTITSNRGDIHVASLKAPVTATANHGDIELSAITGPATAHLNNGSTSVSAHSLAGGLTIAGHADDVTLSDISGPVNITGEFFGTTHIERVAGTVHFHTSRTDLQFARLDGDLEISPHSELTGDQLVGPFSLTTSNRNINLDRVAGDISVTNRNGSIEVTAAPALGSTALGSLSLQNRNGSIKAIVPEHANFSVQADTTDGEISTEFPLTPQSGGSNRKNLSGNIGAGGPSIHMTTTNGDISLNKGDITPLPPVPPTPPKLTLTPPEPATPPQPKAPTKAKAPAKPAPPAQPAPSSTP